jgi:hypothetical protein
MRRRPSILLAAALPALAGTAGAAELAGARLQAVPERPYVGQPFELSLHIEVSAGAELTDLALDGLSLDALETMQPFRSTGERRQMRRGDRTLDALQIAGRFRGRQPLLQDVNAALRASLVERRSSGFFSSWTTVPAAVRVAPFRLEIRPLPAAGVPEGFRGAVGVFNLRGRAEPWQVAPGDLVNLEYNLGGVGWLGAALPVMPDLGPHFRAYPPEVVQREEEGTRLTLRQVVIPLDTNATLIAGARLPFFNPGSGAYEETTAGPFRLVLVAARPATNLPTVKNVVLPPAPPAGGAGAVGAAAETAIGRLRQVAPYGIALLAAILVAGLLYAWRPRVAVAAGIAVLLAGAYAGRLWQGRAQQAECRLLAAGAARLAPAAASRELFRLASGATVVPLEHTEGWTRVDAGGRRGWVADDLLQPPRP